MGLRSLLTNLENTPISIFGAGITGLSVSHFLANKKAKVTLLDDINQEALAEKTSELLQLHPNIKLKSGLKNFSADGAKFIVVSPGIPLQHPAIIAATKKDISIVNEIDLAFSYLEDMTFVGVTGTNGKSTTTMMLGSIFETVDPNVFVGGNLGNPLCNVFLQKKKPKFVILELSSFQLEAIRLLKLKVAVVTNLAPDHLDRYPNIEKYYRAKSKILELLQKGGFAVVNQGDESSNNFLAASLPPSTTYFNVLDNQVGVKVLSKALHIQTSKFSQKISLDSKTYHNKPNLENAAAAAAVCTTLKIPFANIEKGLKNFKGISHRLEFLGKLDNISWINDSKATNPQAAIASVINFDNGVHLILGGANKKADYKSLAKSCETRVKAIYAIGEESKNILEAFQDHKCHTCETLENAVKKALENTASGDTLLLAPACASTDQFKNFKERGEAFQKLFHNHKEALSAK